MLKDEPREAQELNADPVGKRLEAQPRESKRSRRDGVSLSAVDQDASCHSSTSFVYRRRQLMFLKDR